MDKWIVDANGDGYPDDVSVRIVLDLPDGAADHAFWAALLDLTARVGLGTHALPLPLVVPGPDVALPEGVQAVTVRAREDLVGLLREPTPAPWHAAPLHQPPSRCLTRLFTIDGALEDRDGDLLPDAARIAFDLPGLLPAALGAAVANLAARVGLESGGVTFPVVRADGARFSVAPSDGPARLRVVEYGWRAEGDPDELARLLERVAADWPHISAPETGGAGAALATLRRWLAGDGPEPHVPGEVVWEADWAADWEVDVVLDEIETETLEWLLTLPPDQSPDVTVFVSEPPEERARLRDAILSALEDDDFLDSSVTVLSAFKAGLSWLREVVTPALAGQPVARVRLSHARYDGAPGTLDLPLRWLQELFPGPELLARDLGLPLDAVEVVEVEAGREPVLGAEAFAADGAALGRWECSPPHAIQPFVDAIPDSGLVVAPSAQILVHCPDGETRRIEVATDLQSFWGFWQERVIPRLLAQIDAQGGPRAAAQPFFGELLAEVWVSEPNEALGLREENDSAAEALAEDIYFTTLDAIELYGQRVTGERCNAPGAIVPLVHVTPGEPPRARVTLRAAPARRDLPRPDLRVDALRRDGDELVAEVVAEVDGPSDLTQQRLRELAALPAPNGPSLRVTVELDELTVELRLPLPALLEPLPASEPPMDRNIWGEEVVELARRLASFPEVTAWVEDTSYQGRPVVGMALAAPTPGRLHAPAKAALLKPTHLIVARHHANEISSTNAAFRLAWLCANDSDWRRLLDRVNILLLPYENPDGAALHARLAAEPEAATWKHHPARYNALGYEFSEAMFDPDTRFGEARARPALWRRWPADVVVDNHGVPSHEWVQPFAGFGSPPRFQVSYWVVQALLYGIARYVDDPAFPAHREAVEALRQAVSDAVRDTDIGEWNRVYWESYRFWGQSRLPERFPGDFSTGMLWHVDGAPPDPAGRGFAVRYPRTTVLSWVTEVNDETARGEHLERVARAHLLANRATLALLHAAAPAPRWWQAADGTLRFGRERPLAL